MFDLSLAANKIIEMTLDGRLSVVWLFVGLLVARAIYEATTRNS